MVLKLVEVLQKGLKIVTNCIKLRKKALQAQLAEGASISSEDKQWLDHDANLVDELHVLEVLEDSPDYEQAFSRLDGEQKEIVRRLHKATHDLSKAVGKKQKYMSSISWFYGWN